MVTFASSVMKNIIVSVCFGSREDLMELFCVRSFSVTELYA